MKRFTLVALALLGCGDSGSQPAPVGVDVERGPCGHALVVVNSDYQSSSVAIVGYAGEVLAGSIVSSASETTGLSVPLSKDVVLPTTRTTGGDILLIDREQAVLTVLDPVNAVVRQQIKVGTGFGSNPQDVIEVGGGTLYVSRYGSNATAGSEPFDEGSDVLVVDGASGAIEGRIDLSTAMEGAPEVIFPNPSRMVAGEGRVFLLLSAFSKDFSTSDDGRVAVVDTGMNEIVSVAVIDGMRGCLALAIAPGGERLAVGCSGTFAASSTPSLEDSGVVVLKIGEGGALSEVQRFSAQDLGGDPISSSLSFASDSTILLATFGRVDDSFAQARPDRLLALDLESGTTRELARTQETPFSIGEIHCQPACGVCFAADAEKLGVLRLPIEIGALGEPEIITIDDGIGLPPRSLGAY